MQKKKRESNAQFIHLCIYGIWSKDDKRIIYVSTLQEDVETEFDLENYSDEKYMILRLETMYNVNGLEL